MVGDPSLSVVIDSALLVVSNPIGGETCPPWFKGSLNNNDGTALDTSIFTLTGTRILFDLAIQTEDITLAQVYTLKAEVAYDFPVYPYFEATFDVIVSVGTCYGKTLEVAPGSSKTASSHIVSTQDTSTLTLELPSFHCGAVEESSLDVSITIGD